MYSQSDPRSRLSAATPYATKQQSAGFAAAEYIKFHEQAPHTTKHGSRTWYGRGQNFVVSYSEATAGVVLERKGQLDEYFLLIPRSESKVRIQAADGSHDVAGHSLVIVPPGDSAITVTHAGMLVRVFTTLHEDLNQACVNAGSYRQAHPHVAALLPWPEPIGGYCTRIYSLDVPAQEGRFGRIWRTRSLMINVVPIEGPRDVTKLSPHHHDDFEQCSLAIEGAFMHHIRWPWTANSTHWRADEHELCPAPSMAVIPPPAIHTSNAIDPTRNHLIDIFSPPRLDFSRMPGWVLNADEYPMPP